MQRTNRRGLSLRSSLEVLIVHSAFFFSFLLASQIGIYGSILLEKFSIFFYFPLFFVYCITLLRLPSIRREFVGTLVVLSVEISVLSFFVWWHNNVWHKCLYGLSGLFKLNAVWSKWLGICVRYSLSFPPCLVSVKRTKRPFTTRIKWTRWNSEMSQDMKQNM